MKLRIAVVSGLAVVLVVGCQPSSPPPPAATPAAPSDLGPVAGWSWIGEVATYDADGLWQLIDGAADRFVANGFRSLEVRQLTRDGIRLEVQIYDLGTPDNALTMLAEESPGLEPLPIGGGALLSPPYQALLVSGRLYVKLDVLEGGLGESESRSLLIALATALAEHPVEPS